MTASRLAVPGTPDLSRTTRPTLRRLKRRHALMLALALEVLALGAFEAHRSRVTGIIVETPSAHGHVIT